jgi:hypothetical protein
MHSGGVLSWDISIGEEPISLITTDTGRVAISPDSQTIAITSGDVVGGIQLWNATDGTVKGEPISAWLARTGL